MTAYNSLTADGFYYSPFFFNRVRTNPFNLDERNFPIDIGSIKEERITMSISLPPRIRNH